MYFLKETADKYKKFRKDKRAHFSLIILATLFFFSMFAELIFNDKPLMMTVDEKLFFPFIQDLTLKDLGGEKATPILDYHSSSLLDFLEGRSSTIDFTMIFGKDMNDYKDLNLNERKINSTLKKHKYKLYCAPIRCDAESPAYPNIITQVSLLSPTLTFKDRHFLGTDKEGKDVLARIVYGFRISLIFGLALAISGAFVGCIIGGIQGYFGGITDLLGQRMTEIWGAMPRLYLLIIFSSFLTSSAQLSETGHMFVLFFILNLTAWMGMATYMRAEFLQTRNFEYVKAAKALGVSDFKIMVRHILPNSLTPIITFFPFSVSGGIFALVSLDFLGLGVRYPAPSLGELLNQGKENLYAWWILVPTFIVLTFSLTLLTFIGEGIKTAFSVKKNTLN
jgi:microcin C transport system permease protein